MSRKITKDGHTFNVRGLKRKEVKQLRDSGFDLACLNPAVANHAMDAVFDCVFDKDQIQAIDDMPNVDALEIFRAVMGESFGSEGEEKNS